MSKQRIDMAKGHQAHKDRLNDIQSFGKAIGKRAGFKCEWCESKDDLRLWGSQPEQVPDMETLALLCQQCRDLADGKKAQTNELRPIRSALWSNIPAVAEGAARVLVQCKEPWVREAIEESFIDEQVKAELLKILNK
jgi:protein PhnA